MRKVFSLLILLSAIFAVSTPFPSHAAETVIDMVLAVVDDEPVTASEVRRFLFAQGRPASAANLDTHSPEVKRAVQEVVTDKMLRKEADEAGIKVSGDDIDAYIKEIKAQNQVDDAGFQSLLSQQGLSFEEYKRQVEGDILRARVISARVKSRVNVVEEDIEKATGTGKAKAESKEAETITKIDKLEGIFVPFSVADSENATGLTLGRTKEQAKSLAEQLVEKARDKKSLVDVEKELHIDFGVYKPGDLKEELQEAAKALDEDDVSPVVETSNGYYILHRFVAEVEAKPTATVLDDSTKEKVKKELLETRFRERLNKFLTEELPAKYHVDMKI